MTDKIPAITPYQKALNAYNPDVYPAHKKITAEEWNALMLSLFAQGNRQEDYIELIINEHLTEFVETVNDIIDSIADHKEEVDGLLDGKVDKEEGKGLSTNDLTNTLKTAYDEAVNKKHEHSNKTVLDSTTEAFTTALKADYDGAVTAKHTHSNKDTLDSTNAAFTTTLKTNYDDAVTAKHEHSNNTILDATTASYTTDEKSKLAALESSHFRGQYLSKTALDAAIPSGNVGDYAYVDTGAGFLVQKYLWDSSDNEWVPAASEGGEETPASIKYKYESNPDTNAYTNDEKTKVANALVDTSDIKDTVTTFTEASTRANIGTGESTATLFGKIKKYFTDLKTHAFNDLATVQGTETNKAPTNKLLQESSYAAVYRGFTDSRLGVTASTVTPIELSTAMANNSILIAQINKTSAPNLLPDTALAYGGSLIVYKIDAYATKFSFEVASPVSYTKEYYIGFCRVASTSAWIGWKQLFTTDNISTVMPISSAAASNAKVLGEKVVYDNFAPKASPEFTGVQISNGGLVGSYRLVPTGNSLNYYKFATITLGTSGATRLDGVISFHPYAADGYVESANISIACRSGVMQVNISGYTNSTLISRLGTLYATIDADNNVSLYYKQGGIYTAPRLTITGGYTYSTVAYNFALTDTGSTNNPTTPSGGSAGSFVYTDYKQIATTDSPTFTGNPSAPTPTTAQGIANKEYVDNITKKIKTNTKVSFDENRFLTKTWTGLTDFNGGNIWTDGVNIYYSFSGTDQYVLDVATSTWSSKTWTGLTSFSGYTIWTDGTNIYRSSGSSQYVLDVATSTWSSKTWTGLTDFNGGNIWTDGVNIYYSSGTDHYVLNVSTSTWSSKTWTGLTSFNGSNIWTDGTNIYYSGGTDHYVLNVSTSTWSSKTWTGLTDFTGYHIWTDGTNIYRSSGSSQYVLANRLSINMKN